MASRGRGGKYGSGRGRSEVYRLKNTDRRKRSSVRDGNEVCACEANTPLLRELRNFEEECSRTGKHNLRCGVKRAIRSVKLYPLPITNEAEACALEGVGSFTARRMLRCLPSRQTSEILAGSGGSKRFHSQDVASNHPRGDPSDRENVRPDPAPHATQANHDQPRSSDNFCSSVDYCDDTLRGIGGSQPTYSLASMFSALLRDGGDNNSVANDDPDANDATPRRPTSRVRREEDVESCSEGLLPAPRAFSGRWEALLLVDNRERNFMSVKSALLQRGVLCETRQLPLGDMLWVARREDDPASEVLLGFIVERKTPTDLASSIVDGRYEEQKRRLKLSGLRRCIYLVEGNLSHQSQLAPTALRTALASSQACGGLAVVRSASLRDTVDFLARTHRHVASLLRITCSSGKEDRSGGGAGVSREALLHPVMTYGEYAQACSKRTSSTTARQVLGAMVRQAPGCSAARAEAIVQAFDSPLGMILAFERAADCGREVGVISNVDRIKKVDDLLADLRCGGGAGMNKLSQPLRRLLARLFLEESIGSECFDSGISYKLDVTAAESKGSEIERSSRERGVYPLSQEEDMYCSQK